METTYTLKKVLLEETEKAYTVTEKLFQRVDDNELNWKPETGNNWMTLGQLLMHCSKFACGEAVQGLITGDWGSGGNGESGDQDAEHHPSVEDLPYVESVDQAIKKLKEDKELTMKCISKAEESEFLSKKIVAPWGTLEMSLLQQVMTMIAHLAQHKGQLFYYLKLMEKDVNSVDLWGEV